MIGMDILAVGDMHGNLNVVLKALEQSKVDLLVSTGDWGDPNQVDEGIFQAIVARVPVLTVYGNHDYVDLLRNAKNQDGSLVLLSQGEVREFGGLRFVGISGIWAKSHRKPHYVTDEDVRQIAEHVAHEHEHVDVMITHGCAIGLADEVPGGGHGGQRCFLEAFRQISPRLYLCGHLHLPQKRVLKDGRTIINVGYGGEGDYWIVSFKDQTIDAYHYKI